MLLLSTATTELSPLFVVCMGMGTVFVGLICIIILVKIMSFVIGKIVKDEPVKKAVPAAPAAPAAAPVSAEIPNRGEFVAAVSAAIAEELGTDVSKIQIHSIKRI